MRNLKPKQRLEKIPSSQIGKAKNTTPSVLNIKEVQFKNFKNELLLFFKKKGIKLITIVNFLNRIDQFFERHLQNDNMPSGRLIAAIKIECACLRSKFEECKVSKDDVQEFQKKYDSLIDQMIASSKLDNINDTKEVQKEKIVVKETKTLTHDSEPKLIPIEPKSESKDSDIQTTPDLKPEKTTAVKDEKSVILLGFKGNKIEVHSTSIDIYLSRNSDPSEWSYLIIALSIEQGLQETPKKVNVYYFKKIYDGREEYQFSSQTQAKLESLNIKTPREYNVERLFAEPTTDKELLKSGGSFYFSIYYQQKSCFTQGSGYIHIQERESSNSGSGWGTAVTRFIFNISSENPFLQCNISSDTSYSSHIFHLKNGMVPEKKYSSIDTIFGMNAIEDIETFLQQDNKNDLENDIFTSLADMYKSIKKIPDTVPITKEVLFENKQFFSNLLEIGVPFYLTHTFNPMLLQTLQKNIGNKRPDTSHFYCIPMILSKEGIAAWTDDRNGVKKFKHFDDYPQLKMTDEQNQQFNTIRAQHEAALKNKNTELTIT